MKFLARVIVTFALALFPVSIHAAGELKLAENVKTTGKATFVHHRDPLLKGVVVEFTTYYFPDAVVADFHTSQGQYLVRVNTDAKGAQAWKKGAGPLDKLVRETVFTGNWIHEFLSVAPYAELRMMKNRLDATVKGETRSSTQEPDGSTRARINTPGTALELSIKDGALVKKLAETKGVYREQISNSNFDTTLTYLPRTVELQMGLGVGKPMTMRVLTEMQTIQRTAPGDASDKIVDNIKQGMKSVTAH